MAKQIHALNAYRPRIKKGKTLRRSELAEYISGRASINEGTVLNILTELRDAILFWNRQGTGVKLDGLGTYSPEIGLDGKIRVAHYPDVWLKGNLNLEYKFDAKIINRDMIGKTAEDLVARWNEEHPEDPIDVKKKEK
jgi:hypothetical protein